VDSDAPRWSRDVRQADWIGPLLVPWEGDRYPITILVPAGFEAYARILHPVDVPENGGRLIRWADVAAWSGLPLRADAQFHSVALPPADPGRPYPYGGQGPREGTLYTEDARVIAAIAGGWTSTPQNCWFCTWDGFGWDAASTSALSSGGANGAPPERVAEPGRDPVPAPVREGPRVRLPNREYLLYRGPAEDVTATAALDGDGQCASLWWPADRAWCVASDVDLAWTYIGGPRGLIDAILADERIEAFPASAGDPVSRVEGWVAAWVDELADGLLARGEASLTTCRGSVEARLRRPRRLGMLSKGTLFTQVTGAEGDASATGETTLSGPDRLRDELILYLTLTVLGLAGM
jgi:hypothetical protein